MQFLSLIGNKVMPFGSHEAKTNVHMTNLVGCARLEDVNHMTLA